jgi:hypothetical protein
VLDRLGVTASTGAIVAISTREQQQESQEARPEAISHLSRRSRTEHLAQNQAQSERAHMDQLPIQDVLVFA